jgi:hypothetical protein
MENASKKMFRCKIGEQVFGPVPASELRRLPGFTLRALIAPDGSENWAPVYKAIDLSEMESGNSAEVKQLDMGLQEAWGALAGTPSISVAMPLPEEPRRTPLPIFNLSEHRPDPDDDGSNKFKQLLARIKNLLGPRIKLIVLGSTVFSVVIAAVIVGTTRFPGLFGQKQQPIAVLNTAPDFPARSPVPAATKPARKAVKSVAKPAKAKHKTAAHSSKPAAKKHKKSTKARK